MGDKQKIKADLKVVILGDVDVGKTTFIRRYIDGSFTKDIEKTIGASFFLKRVGPNNVAIWDTAGQEKYAGLSSFYCRGAGAAVMAFDLSSKKSFESLKTRYVSLTNTASEDCLKVVIGTKSDRLSQLSREVSNDEGRALAADMNQNILTAKPDLSIPYFETSSLVGTNINEAFDYIFYHFFGDAGSKQQAAAVSPRKDENTVRLSDVSISQPPPRTGCCQ